MRKLINFCFKGDDKQIMKRQFDATWNDNKNKSEATFDKASLKLALNFPIDICFFFILVNCHFDKHLEYPWVLTQNFL